MRAIILLSTLFSLSNAYKILGIFPVPSRSHGILAKGIVDALLDAGHEVTWASPYTDWKPHENLKLVDVSATLKMSEAINMAEHGNDGISFVEEFFFNVSKTANQVPQLRETLVRENFDAVITEWCFNNQDAGYAAVQQVPWIVLSGMVVHPALEMIMDEVRTISTIPMMMLSFPIPMNFLQRLVNTGVFTVMWMRSLLSSSTTAGHYESFFGPLAVARGVQLPPYSEALHNISVMFVNSHPSIAPAQNYPHNMIDVAGYHIAEASPLPKDLQDILDSSSKGVVYFSMGSVLKSSALPEQTKKDLIQLLSELPYTVLWKFEEKLEGVPKNVHIRPWFPQASVLAHKNIKLFITHGGLLSTLEAVHNGVPILAIPVFGDQPTNADRAALSGYAVKVPYRPDMKEELRVALKEILGNDKYYKQAKYLSKIFKNRPVKQSKLIAHYVELAIETKGAYHLRSKSKLYPWYQRWMLDQLAAVLAVLYAIYRALKMVVCLLRSKPKKQKKN